MSIPLFPTTSRRRRPMPLRVALSALAALGASPVAAIVVQAPGASAATAESTVFQYLGGSTQLYTVPSGVYAIDVLADGAQGGSGGGGTAAAGSGGVGAQVDATFDVTPGELLAVEVGQHGATAPPYGGAGVGGNASLADDPGGGGGNGDLLTVTGGGGGGGGATEVGRYSDPRFPAGVPLVVAGGGGGGGGGSAIVGYDGGAGGSGNGGNGASGAGPGAGAGGAGNAAPTPQARPGGSAGYFTLAGGGGGGGGGFNGSYTFGGVGGAPGGVGAGGGGGGGGGSSYVEASAVSSSLTTAPQGGDGMVAITPVPVPAIPTVTSSVDPSLIGQATTLTASIPVPSGAPAPTGSVVWYDGSTVLGQSTVVNGVASLAESGLLVGSHPLSAAYSGDANYSPEVSAPLTQVVQYALGTLSTKQLAFPTEPVGSASAPQVLTLTSTGTAPLDVSKVSIGAATFHVVGNSCSGAVLQPGQSCTLSLSFKPTTVGAVSARLMVSTDGGFAKATLTGTGVAAGLPVVNAVNPDNGYTYGGTTVTIAGVNLAGATQVLFGTVPASGVSCAPTSCTAVSPPASQYGAVDVRVVAPGGTSPVTAADQFIYHAHF